MVTCTCGRPITNEDGLWVHTDRGPRFYCNFDDPTFRRMFVATPAAGQTPSAPQTGGRDVPDPTPIFTYSAQEEDAEWEDPWDSDGDVAYRLTTGAA